MDMPRLTGRERAFMVAVPLAWAALLVFHPNPTDRIHEGLAHQAAAWQAVHLGTLAFIGLIGAVLHLLVCDLPGTAARLSRMAIGPFVLFYGAGEAILGVATGVLVEHANHVPPADRAAAAGAVQALWDDVVAADLIIGIGSAAWAVAVVAAAVAHRRDGAPPAVPALLVLSSIALVHTPPFGPVGLLFLAGAVALLSLRRRATRAPATPSRARP